MNLTTGTIVAGKLIDNGIAFSSAEFTVRVPWSKSVTMGEQVTVVSTSRLFDVSLKELVCYLKDRPSLISDNEVKHGVRAIELLLEK